MAGQTGRGTAGRRPREVRGRILVHTGTGKGKTTAALGLALRAVGDGLRVAMVQFVKGHWRPGEVKAAAFLPGFDLFPMGRGFTWTRTPEEHLRALAAAWAKTQEVLRDEGYGVVILDEINYVLGSGKLPVAEVFTVADLVAALTARPAGMHVVLTGRYAPEAIVALADTVTEMRLVKHAFQEGRPATKGIEF